MNPPLTRRMSKGWRRFRNLLAVLVVGGLMLVALAGFGPPAIARARLFAELEALGIPAESGRLVWRPTRGFVFNDLKLYSTRDRVTPWLHAESLRLRPGFRRWMRDGIWSAKVELRGGKFETELGLWADDLQTRGLLQLQQMRASFVVDSKQLILHEASGRLHGIQLWISGEVPLGPLEGSLDEEPSMSWVPPAARTLADILHVVREFQFETPAVLHARLRPSAQAGERLAVDAELTFRGMGQHRGYPFHRLDVLTRYQNETLHVDSVRFGGEAGRELFAQASVDFANDLASLRLRNTLPRHAVEHLSPIPLSSLLEKIHLRIEGRCDVDLRFGPSPFEHFGESVQGTLHLGEAFYRDAFFPEISMELEYANQLLILEEIRAEVGQGRLRGPASGSLHYDDRTGALRLQAEAAFNPAAVLSLIDDEITEQTLREWEFSGPPPHLSLTVILPDRGSPPEMKLQLDAREVMSRGAFFATLSAKVDLDARELRIQDLRAARNQEWLEGNIRYLLDEELLHVDVLSTIRLQELAPLISPKAVELLQPYRLQGENWIKIAGIVDLTEENRHKLIGKANLNDVIWQWMKFDTLSFSFDLQGDRLTVPDIEGSLNQGLAEGRLVLEQLFDPAEANFHLKLAAAGVDLFKLITAATDTLSTPYTGNLSVDLDLKGALNGHPDPAFFQQLQGKAAVEIRDGELFRIPLLLGLSRILGKVVRGFGYASQSTFRADLQIGEGLISSRNLFLEGRLLSIEGEGHIGFDKSLHANMKVQLLSQGLVSDVVNTLLWPVRKLIEVRLTGTLDEPEWYPRNLPREIFQ